MSYFNLSNPSRNHSNTSNNSDNFEQKNDGEEKNRSNTSSKEKTHETKDRVENRHINTENISRIPVLKITEHSKENPLPIQQTDNFSVTRNIARPNLETLSGTTASTAFQPASPRSPRSSSCSRPQLEAQPSPRRLKVDGRVIGDSANTNANTLSPRLPTVAPLISTTTTVAEETPTTTAVTHYVHVPLAITVTSGEQKDQPLATQSAYAEEKAYLQTPADSSGIQQCSAMQYMRVRVRINSKVLAENAPSSISPRSHNGSTIKTTTSDQIISIAKKTNVPREKIVADTVRMYSKSTLENLKPGKADSIKTIARMDPSITAEEMPETLKAFYVSTSKKSMPISPLLRNLYKASFRNTAHWKNALTLAKEAIEKCNPKISIAENDESIKKSEKEKLQPLANAIVDALLPVAANVEKNPDDISLRYLDESILTKDFIENVIFVVDQNIITACKKDPELSVKEINDIRYFMLVDLIATRMLAPMLGNLFPDHPSQSHIWLQSALLFSLKKALPGIAKDFFDRSVKEMPSHLSSFLDQKARQEEENSAKERNKNYYQQFSTLKEKSNSMRNTNYYEKLISVKDRRVYTGKNSAMFEKLVEQLTLAKAGDEVMNFIQRQISQKLRAYMEEQKIDQIRFDLLSILHGSLTALLKKQNAIPPDLTAAIQDLSRQVAFDKDSSVQKRTVAFSEDVIHDFGNQLIQESQTVIPDEEYIDFAMFETFHLDQEDSGTNTTSSTTAAMLATTTTTTTTTMNTTLSPSTTTTMNADYSADELNPSSSASSSREKVNS